MSVMPVEATAETQAPPVEKETPPPSLRERQEAIFDKFVTTETGGSDSPVADAKPAAEGTEAADPDGGDIKPEEQSRVEPEKIVVSPDQLADTAYWGKLDADGWKRMERDYPTETKLVKSWQATVTRVENRKRVEAQAPPPEQRSTTLPDDEKPSAELLAAVRMSQSLDDDEAARGHLLIAKLTTPAVLKENGFDPAKAQAQATVDAAYAAAVVELPELATFASAELDEAVNSNRTLKALVNIGTPEALTEAMIGAGQILSDRKKAATATAAATKAAADAKKKETQRVVQSNAAPASAGALASHGASPDTRTRKERMSDAYDREVVRQGGATA